MIRFSLGACIFHNICTRRHMVLVFVLLFSLLPFHALDGWCFFIFAVKGFFCAFLNCSTGCNKSRRLGSCSLGINFSLVNWELPRKYAGIWVVQKCRTRAELRFLRRTNAWSIWNRLNLERRSLRQYVKYLSNFSEPTFIVFCSQL